RAAGLEQPLHQRVDIVLQQRLAAGDLDQGALVAIDHRQHLVNRHLAPFVERVRRVAPRAAEVAGGEPPEDAGTPRVGRLPLNRMEDLVDRQHGTSNRRARDERRARFSPCALGVPRLLYYCAMAKPTFYWKPT